jgi:TPR repeat protein
MVVKNAAKEKRVFIDTLKDARIGLREAQYEVGLMFANGVGVAQDLTQAIDWIRQAAERGLPAAQYLLGSRYASGIGLEKDTDKSFFWFQKAADQGHLKAVYRLAKLHASAHQALSNSGLLKAAEQGLADAQFALGANWATGKCGAKNDELALFWYRSAAEQGLAAAQYALAELYANGQSVPVDLDVAQMWFRKAALQNFAAAHVALEFLDVSGQGQSAGRGRKKQNATERRRESERWATVAEHGDADTRYNVGLMFELGLGVLQDVEQAKSFYLLAARSDDARAQLALAKIYEGEQDRAATGWYLKAAQQGNIDAQFALGRNYSSAENVDQDHFTGISWYLKAGEQGDARALMTLGHLFGGGLDHMATASFRRAAQLGVAEAQFFLGQQYSAGKGVPQDFYQAFAWFSRAGEQGYAQAQSAMGSCYLTGNGVARNFSQALAWFQKAADQQDSRALWNMGSMYASGGDGVVQDLRRAFECCQKAADLGFVPAQATLGVLFARIKNLDQAVFWWGKAAEQGDPEAQYNLALMFNKGQGVEQNLELAFHWFGEAAQQGVPSAQSRLGIVYATGEGVALDAIEAHKWFIIASESGDEAGKTNQARSETLLNSSQLNEARRRAKEWLQRRVSLNKA